MTSTLCAIMKNEERYITEWVAYHRIIGFDRVIIYENDSTDCTAEILETLQLGGFIDDYVSWRNVRGGSPQILAYEDAVRNCKTDWIMFLDADEFLNFYAKVQVNEFLERFESSIVGVAVNWRIFGSGGERQYKEDLVLSRFTKASLPTAYLNHAVKSFVRPQFVEGMHIHAPWMKSGQFVTAAGNPLHMARQGISDTIDCSVAQINHYFTKSYDEFNLKKLRGNANRDERAIDKYTRYSDSLFTYHDLNDVPDTSILWALPKIENELAQMRPIVQQLRRSEGLRMTGVQEAILWWRQLFTELGTTASTGEKSAFGEHARKRVGALVNLFFIIAKQTSAKNLLEIGAHNAETSRRFIAENEQGRAFAYEASQPVFERVIKNNIPDRLEMFNCAIGAVGGSVSFFVPVEERYQVWGSTRKRAGHVETKEFTVPVITLDEAANRISKHGAGRDVALWIDVEGGGFDVLRGGQNALAERVSLIYIEVNDFETYEGSSTSLDILQTLLGLGFVPIGRDNQYHDAWNLLLAHQTTYQAARIPIAKWMYAYSPLSSLFKSIEGIK